MTDIPPKSMTPYAPRPVETLLGARSSDDRSFLQRTADQGDSKVISPDSVKKLYRSDYASALYEHEQKFRDRLWTYLETPTPNSTVKVALPVVEITDVSVTGDGIDLDEVHKKLGD